MKKNLILIGPPGAGKGTQAERLKVFLKVPHISTGDIFRWHIQAKTDLGKKAQDYTISGQLVPDSLLFDLIRSRLSEEDAQQGWILDGFPRTIPQAEFLEALLKELKYHLDCVLELKVSDAIAKERMARRAMEAKPPRPDDADPGVCATRLEVYWNQTSPLLKFYKTQKKLITISGDPAADEVTTALKDMLV